MIPDLIIYNYQTETIGQDIVVRNITGLLGELKKCGVDTGFLNIIDGNNSYPDTCDLIGRVLGYWGRQYDPLPTSCIYQSFLILYRHLRAEKIRSYKSFFVNGALLPSNGCQKICNDLIGLAEGNENPAFFNAIIITGRRYRLEAPFGVALNTIFEGGICLNANIEKKSIWHETVHLLGAKDHYDEKNTHLSRNCADPANCLMRWNALNGHHFCKNTIMEIDRFFIKTKKFIFV